MHYFEALHHAEEGWLSATSENMALNVDMTVKKVARVSRCYCARLARMKAAHGQIAGARRRRPAHRNAEKGLTKFRSDLIARLAEAVI